MPYHCHAVALPGWRALRYGVELAGHLIWSFFSMARRLSVPCIVQHRSRPSLIRLQITPGIAETRRVPHYMFCAVWPHVGFGDNTTSSFLQHPRFMFDETGFTKGDEMVMRKHHVALLLCCFYGSVHIFIINILPQGILIFIDLFYHDILHTIFFIQ